MKEQIISFETAQIAKEKGFEQNPYKVEYCYGPTYTDGSNINLRNSLYNPESNICTAPSQSALQRWLREIHQIETRIWAEHYPNGTNWCCQALQWDLTLDFKTSDLIKNGTFAFGDNGEFKTYEESLEFILQEAVKMIANQHTKFKILK